MSPSGEEGRGEGKLGRKEGKQEKEKKEKTEKTNQEESRTKQNKYSFLTVEIDKTHKDRLMWELRKVSK